MKRKLQRGWWLVVLVLLLVLAIQVMLIRESYQYEKFVFINKMEQWMEKSVADLNFKSYDVPKMDQNIFSVDFRNAFVRCIKNGVEYKFKYDKNIDKESVHYRVMYDYRGGNVWNLTRLDSIFQLKTKELGFPVPINYVLEDTLGHQIDHYATAELSRLWSVKLKPIELGFIEPHRLQVSYEFPFQYYWAVAADRLLLAGMFFLIFVFCVYWLYRTIMDERRANQNQDRLIHALVHNLKNPVVSCIAGLDMIRTANFSEGEKQDLIGLKIDMILLKYNIEDLLLADANAKGFRLRLSEFDLAALVEEAVLFYGKLRIPNKTVELKVVYNKSVSFKIVADRGHMLGVLSNLIDNSIKYSGNEVKIVLSLYRKEHRMEIRVRDNGWGVVEEDLKNMFESGYRGISPIGGYGLGLNYVKMVLVAHKGWVEVKSGVYSGSRFLIALPYRKTYFKFGKWQWKKDNDIEDPLLNSEYNE